MSIGTVTFTPRGADSWADPWGEYAALRTHDPVHHVVPPEHPERDYYVLSRHADILAAAVDTQTFSSAQGLTTAYGEIEAIGLAEPPLVMQDPPAHTAFRKLVARGFTPRQVADLEPDVRAFVRERLPALADGGDVVETLFKPLPSMMLAYFAALVERRRREPLDDPGPDTVAHLVAAGRADDQDGLVAVLGYVFTMVTGGNDTTTGLLGGAVQLLAADPAQRARLTSGEVPVEVALEELLRLTSPVQGLARTTTRDVELHGVEVPAGRKVLLLYAAGNRDPERYGPDADSLDVGRRPSQILTFSQGSHHCLGAAAARLQGRVALEELLAAYPDFEVDPAGVRWAPGPYVRRPAAVPFVGRP
ncbi:cytochrome P450 [Nocardioides sp. REDSEA-S30_B4]|uniref:cytochrome P450 n=1 Tax=Nocardioides sp. REDSEA-S30_B4 TaxID=1811552 RepID=UPI000A81C024|nr:cytochrome P450 [Nocardioides sp. REDSEA-S30_B4]